MIWQVDKRKRGAEIWVSSEQEAIFIGDGYTKEERKRSEELARVIASALNIYHEVSTRPERKIKRREVY